MLTKGKPDRYFNDDQGMSKGINWISWCWEHIRKDLQTMRIENWKKSVLDRDSWKAIVEQTIAHNEL
jgi:hypothetical protein